jgi:hypothetical protein
MLKFMLLPLLFLTLGAAPAAALAADDPTATVVAVDGNQVTLKVTADVPTWAKPGAYLKASDTDGKIVVRRGKIAKVENGTILLSSAEAKNVKVGKVYKIAKARVNEGC